MVDVIKLYADGKYNELIKLAETQAIDPALLLNSLVKSNQLNKAVWHFIGLMQNMAYAEDQNTFEGLLSIIKSERLMHLGIQNLRMFGLGVFDKFYNQDFKDDLRDNFKSCLVFPIIWPIAYGDMIVIHQFIKYYKLKHNKKVLLIMPLNRPELRQLSEMNSSITKVIDITLMKEQEKQRQETLGLLNNGVLNVILQEAMIQEILKILVNPTIIKLRYLPILNGFDCIAGKRIWEERARMFLEDKKELPKLLKPTAQKKKQIAVHFRMGGYNDEKSRDVNINFAQDLIYALSDLGYEIVRLGDEGMEELDGCRNASHEKLSIKQQAKIIQESKLFIGTHSAPQHLAVACSDTPIICFNYVYQETAKINTDIARMSYEPVGKQVKKILYTKIKNESGDEVLPLHNSPENYSYEHTSISEIVDEAKKVLK